MERKGESFRVIRVRVVEVAAELDGAIMVIVVGVSRTYRVLGGERRLDASGERAAWRARARRVERRAVDGGALRGSKSQDSGLGRSVFCSGAALVKVAAVARLT